MSTEWFESSKLKSSKNPLWLHGVVRLVLGLIILLTVGWYLMELAPVIRKLAATEGKLLKRAPVLALDPRGRRPKRRLPRPAA